MKVYFEILRPINIIITAISSFVAYYISASTDINISTLIFVVLATSFSAGAGNIINDIFDISIDKINKPHRPLPANKISKNNAYIYYYILIILSFIMGYNLGFESFLGVMFVNLILFFYAVCLKRTILFGNMVVALCSGYLFYFSAITTDKKMLMIPVAISAFLFHLIRELIKDAADLKGDKANHIKTFVIHFGLKKTIILIRSLIFVLSVFLTFLFDYYNIYFMGLILTTIIPVLIYIFLTVNVNLLASGFENLSKIMKIDMLFGIVSFLIGMS